MAIASDITHSEYTQVDDMRIPILLAVAVLTVSACDDQGPFERAGEEVDEAFENARAGGETLGNRLDDAADDVRRSTEDALERAREGVEDAADELENR